MENIINELKLTEIQVLKIVKEWYSNGMCEYIFQDEDGIELDEHCENELQNYFRYNQNK